MKNSIFKERCMLSHVTHIVPIDIYNTGPRQQHSVGPHLVRVKSMYQMWPGSMCQLCALHFHCIAKAKTYLIHLFIYSPPEDGHNKQGGDGRCQTASDGLNVVKKLSTIGCLNDRNPHNAQGH